jgi:hypothetical protein
LHEVDSPCVHKGFEFGVRGEEFSAGDRGCHRRGEAAIVFEVLRSKRCFHQKEVELLKSFHAANSLIDVPPAVADVGEEYEVVADVLADGTDVGDDLVVVARRVLKGLNLGRPIPECYSIVEKLDAPTHDVLKGTRTGVEGDVGDDGLFPWLSKERPDGHSGELAGEVPKGHVDRRDRNVAYADSTGPERALVERSPELAGITRLLADQELTDTATPAP